MVMALLVLKYQDLSQDQRPTYPRARQSALVTPAREKIPVAAADPAAATFC